MLLRLNLCRTGRAGGLRSTPATPGGLHHWPCRNRSGVRAHWGSCTNWTWTLTMETRSKRVPIEAIKAQCGMQHCRAGAQAKSCGGHGTTD